MRDKTISMRLLIQTAFQKWRRMLVCGVIFMILISGWKAYRLLPQIKGAGKEESTASSENTGSADTGVSSAADYKKNSDYFKQQIEHASEYVNKSFYTQMDPNAVGMASVDISVSTPELKKEGENDPDSLATVELGSIDETEIKSSNTSSDDSSVVVTTSAEQDANNILNAYKEFILYETDWTAMAEKYNTEPQYLQELVDLSGNHINDTISAEIVIRFLNEQGAGELMDELTAQIQNYTSSVTKTYGEHTLVINNRVTTTVTDTSVTDRVNSRLTMLNNLINGNNSFGTATATLGMNSGNTDHSQVSVSRSDLLKPVVKYAGAGFVGGVVLYFLLVILSLLASGKVYSASEMNRQYGFSKIAVVPSSNAKKRNGLDRLTHRDASDYYSSRDREICWQIANENLSELMNGKGTVALIGDVDPGQLEKIAAEMNKETSELQIKTPGDILSSPAALHSLKETDAAVIIASIGSSDYRKTGHILETLHTYEKRILGSIILDQ